VSSTCDHHHNLTNGVGKCSVPMFMGLGSPAGFCDKPAYGKPTKSPTFYSYVHHRDVRVDGRYHGYVPGLACVGHGGPEATHFGDPCVHCGIPHDEVPPGPCKATKTPAKDETGAVAASSPRVAT
jgi:hypothetical protein